jgi:hypothetical protein
MSVKSTHRLRRSSLLGVVLAMGVAGVAAAEITAFEIDRTANGSLEVSGGVARVGGSVRCTTGNHVTPSVILTQGRRQGSRLGSAVPCETDTAVFWLVTGIQPSFGRFHPGPATVELTLDESSGGTLIDSETLTERVKLRRP